jgi:hypothetical protein
MSHNSSRRLALTALFVGMIVGACGSSSGTAPTTAATPAAATPGTAATAAAATPAAATPAAATPAVSAIASLSATPAAASCPTAATVGAALGITVNKPVGVAGGGATQLPAGAKALVCDYSGAGLNVIIEVIANIDPSSISLFSGKFPVAYASVSGVGDQARSFSQPLNGGKDNEGVVATKGSTLVSVVATGTPATLSQIEALVNQLL